MRARARTVAEAISAGLSVPVCAIAAEEADAHFDWLFLPIAVDAPASTAITQRLLGWQLREKGLLVDMRDSGYVAWPKA